MLVIQHLEFSKKLAVLNPDLYQGSVFQLLCHNAAGYDGNAVVMDDGLLGCFGIVAEPGALDREILELHIFNK